MSQILTEEQANSRIEEILGEGPEFNNDTIKENTRKLLKNQWIESRRGLDEAGEGTQTPDVKNWDPVLVSMIRRAMPVLIANDLVGVQPMSGPSGLIFSLHAWYGANPNASGATEMFVNEPDDTHTGPYATNDGENLGQDDAVNTADSPTSSEDPIFQINPWPELSFSIDKKSVEAETRALKARYTNELETDLRNVHGLAADAEISNLLGSEIVAEINREIVNMLHNQAKPGAQGASTPGDYDLDSDADGRWFEEKIKHLMQQINKESHLIARQTRRGLANWVMMSPELVGALDMVGFVNTNVSFGAISNAGATGPTYAGVLAGRYRVYIDPYATSNYVMLGYKGDSEYDSGMYYAPYTALTWYRSADPESFNPIVGVKTRRGLTTNPFVSGNNGENSYYRKFAVKNL